MNRQSAFAVACAVSATAALGVVASPAQAFELAPGAELFTESVTLDQLVGTDNGFLVEDKIFHNFVFQPNCSGPGNLTCDDITDLPPADRPASPLFPSQVTVGPSVDQINEGSGIGLFLNDDWRANPGWVYDLAFGFDVHVVEDSNQLINDVHLKFIGTQDQGNIVINEDVSDPVTGENLLASGGLVVDNLTQTTDILITDGEDLTHPVKKLRVLKDINLRGTDGETAEFSILIQEFSQTVPEPGTVTGLLALGSLSFGAMLKRNFGKKA